MSKNKTRKTNRSFKEKSEAKKAAFMGAEKRKKPVFLILLAALLLSGGAVFVVKKSDQTSTAVAQAKEISYPTSLFSDGKARHFEWETPDGTVIRYFILKSSDGVLRAAFDACDVCWREGKGYVQNGDHMVCVNCGRRFSSVKVNEVKGGCNPAPLHRAVRNGNLILQRKDILDGKRYFNFGERSEA